MQEVTPLSITVRGLVSDFGGTVQHAIQAHDTLVARETAIASNIIEAARARGIDERLVRNVLADAGLIVSAPMDERIVAAERQVAAAQEQLRQAQASLAAVRR